MKRLAVAVFTIGLVLGATTSPALANHSWGGYHWARTANPFTVKLGDNVSATWRPLLGTASSDWSTVLDTQIVAGQANGRCGATSGRVEVCSGRYGNNGWLGLASISVNKSKHITQGTVKLNDTYFVLPAYNFTTERLHVVCQEVGHTFGLDHQDESGISLNTCMDYYDNTSDRDTKSTHPNAHDYEELELIYGHLDSSATIGAAAASGQSAAARPSLPARATRSSTIVRRFADGSRQVTFIIWAKQLRLAVS